MKTSTEPQRIWLASATLCCAIISGGAWAEAAPAATEPPPSPPRPASLFDRTRTICLGRLLMEVPESAEVEFGTAEIGAGVSRFKEGSSFFALYASQAAGSADHMKNPSRHARAAKEVHKGAVPGQRIVITSASAPIAFIGANSFFTLGEDMYLLRKTISGPDVSKKASRASMAAALTRDMNQLASHLRARGESEAPAEAGVCIDGAFVSDYAQPVHEETLSVTIQLPQFENTVLTLISSSNPEMDSRDDRYMASMKKTAQSLQQQGGHDVQNNIRLLRSGPRQVLDLAGYELLVEEQEKAGQPATPSFSFGANGVVNDPQRPLLNVTLRSSLIVEGPHQEASGVPDAEQAKAFWDLVLSSIRLRPVTR